MKAIYFVNFYFHVFDLSREISENKTSFLIFRDHFADQLIKLDKYLTQA